MTKEEFSKRSFRHSMPYNFKCPRTDRIIECLVIAVNFDGGTLKLWPIPENVYIVDGSDEFWVSYEYCHLPKHKLKAI